MTSAVGVEIVDGMIPTLYMHSDGRGRTGSVVGCSWDPKTEMEICQCIDHLMQCAVMYDGGVKIGDGEHRES